MTDQRERLHALLSRHSVRFGDFVLASGKRSTFYIDVRKTVLTGEGAALIGDLLYELAMKHAPEATGAGGLTLGADPVVTAIAIAAHRKGHDFGAVIVRKQAKEHGTQNWLETAGNLTEGAELVVVDDVVTSASSTVFAIERLREAGFRVEHALAVVDRQESATDNLASVGVALHPLFLLSELVDRRPS